MLPINHFKRALQSGRAQIGVWSTIPSPYVSELIAGAGYDWVLLDTEHTPTDVPLMLSQLQATAAAQPPEGMLPAHAVVRPAWNESVLIKRYLDIGAQTLLLPFVQNAEEARAAVLATRYPSAGIPGIRGMGGSTRAANFGRTADYVARAAEELCVLVQVETAERSTRSRRSPRSMASTASSSVPPTCPRAWAIRATPAIPPSAAPSTTPSAGSAPAARRPASSWWTRRARANAWRLARSSSRWRSIPSC